jgi:AraC-like DNA-binding protein
MPLVAPGVGAELFVHLGAPFCRVRSDGSRTTAPPFHLMRPRTAALDLAPQTDLHFVAVRIRAGATRHLLPMATAELPEGLVDASEIWGAETVALRDRLASVSTLSAQSALLAQWLRGMARRWHAPDPAIDAAISRLYERPDEPLDAALGETALGNRQFERRFKDAAGLAPKRFQRLARAYKLVRFESLTPSESYLPRALDLGFFDQAHAIHEIRDLTGRAPTALFRELATRSHFYNPPRAASS